MRFTFEDDRMLRLLKLLKEGSSGQKIAEELGVSRTSVWKMIKKLESMGYKISARRRVGYKLIESPDLSLYEVARVCYGLRDLIREIYYYEVTDSTNQRAKELKKPGVLIIAERQTAGRGRFGRTWISEPGGLYFSLTLPKSMPIEDVPKLTLTSGVAVAEAIGGRIKWTNDILIHGKKVCGILCELTGEIENPLIIVGIGINVNNPAPKEFNAISLKDVYGKNLNRSEILGRVLTNFAKYYKMLIEGRWNEIRERWKQLSDTLGKEIMVRVAGREIRGLALNIDEDGALILKCDERIERVFSGECFYVSNF
jgi:BirA family biotin operon repressor/biotin-[acetyl-CoA-carboxylase] ligase